MTGRGEKLQQLHCYHPFSDSLDIYLTKNHYENYSPKMVPIAKILGSGSWTKSKTKILDTADALNTAYPVSELDGENDPTFRTLIDAKQYSLPNVWCSERNKRFHFILFHSVTGQRCPRWVGLSAIKCTAGK